MPKQSSRRAVLAGMSATLAGLAAPALATGETRRNISHFVTHDWRDHFDALGVGLIVSDTRSRVLQHWDEGGQMSIYPTSVPMTDELTRRGYTEVVRKRENPSWTPTANMRERDPTLPIRMEGGDPGNPLGTRALYLTWPAYLIHGTHDTRKIGRRSSSGCIGLYNRMVEDLYAKAPIGTKVVLL
ncbi:MAG: L,D-transpeptidase [Shimia sp.]